MQSISVNKQTDPISFFKPGTMNIQEFWLPADCTRCSNGEQREIWGLSERLKEGQSTAPPSSSSLAPSNLAPCRYLFPMAVPAALVVLPFGLLFLLSGLIVNLVQVGHLDFPFRDSRGCFLLSGPFSRRLEFLREIHQLSLSLFLGFDF